MPKVSVVLPVYNNEEHIARTVRSVLRQDFTDFEFIIVNDGSTDRTKEILEGFAGKDPRIVLIHKKNGGIRDSLNVGLDRAAGEYIVRHDAEDLSHRQRIGILVAEMDRRPEISCIATKNIVVNESYDVIGVFPLRNIDDLNGSIERDETYISHPSVIFRRKDVVSIGGYPDVRHAEDFALWKKMREHSLAFHFLNEPLYVIVKSTSGISSENMGVQMENILRFLGRTYSQEEIRSMVEKKIVHERIVYGVRHTAPLKWSPYIFKAAALRIVQKIMVLRFSRYLNGYDLG